MTTSDEAPADHLPTYSECVIGYRRWVVDDQDRLWPIAQDRRAWVPGVNTARCCCGSPSSLRFEWSVIDGRRVLEPAPEHAAPDQACECGLYSWRRPKPEWVTNPDLMDVPNVVGAVASWGRIQVHDEGFRAEHACVVVIAYGPEAGPDDRAVLDRVAGRYGVELVPLSDLEDAARRHGRPLPDDVRPPPPPPADDAADAVADATPVVHAPDATPEEVSLVTRRPRHRVALALAVGVVLVAAAVVALTGHPPKHCTWRQTWLVKGAYTIECVPNHHPSPR